MTRKIILKKINNINIYQFEKGYKITQETLIISSFINLKNINQKILDIGTGIGIIPALLNRRFNKCDIDAVEIQYDLFKIAKKNYVLNKINGNVFHNDVDKLKYNDYYDVIITNPPFFKNGIISKNKEIAKSKHEIYINIEKIAKIVNKILKTRGFFYCIYPSERLFEIFFEFKKSNLQIFAIKFIHSFIIKKSKLVLIVARKNVRSTMEILKPLIIYNKHKEYTDEMKNLYNFGKLEW